MTEKHYIDGQYADEETERQIAEAAAVLRGDAERMERAIFSPDFRLIGRLCTVPELEEMFEEVCDK